MIAHGSAYHFTLMMTTETAMVASATPPMPACSLLESSSSSHSSSSSPPVPARTQAVMNPAAASPPRIACPSRREMPLLRSTVRRYLMIPVVTAAAPRTAAPQAVAQCRSSLELEKAATVPRAMALYPSHLWALRMFMLELPSAAGGTGVTGGEAAAALPGHRMNMAYEQRMMRENGLIRSINAAPSGGSTLCGRRYHGPAIRCTTYRCRKEIS